MKFLKRRWAAVLLCAVLLTALVLPVEAKVPHPTAEYYVFDGAKLLSAQTRLQLVSDARALYTLTGVKTGIILLSETDEDLSTEDYFDALWHNWKMDTFSEQNGFLLLLDLPHQTYYAKADVGLHGALNQDTLCDILRIYMEPDFANGDYTQAICKTYTAISSKIAMQTATMEEEPSKIDKVIGLLLSAEKPAAAARGETTAKLWLSSTGKTLFTVLVAICLLIGILAVILPRLRGGFFSRYRKNRADSLPFFSGLSYKKKNIAGYEVVPDPSRAAALAAEKEKEGNEKQAVSFSESLKNSWNSIRAWFADWVAQMGITGSDKPSHKH